MQERYGGSLKRISLRETPKMEKNKTTIKTSKPEYHVVSPTTREHKGIKLVQNPKKQVNINPRHINNVRETAVAINNKFNDLLFEMHVKSKLTKPIAESLIKKSKQFDIPLKIVEEIFARGISSWNPYICKNLTQEQWAFSRVNSFLNGGKAQKLDADLLEAARTFKSAETDEVQSTDPNSPMSRLDGTKQSKKTYLKATPGQKKAEPQSEESIQEVRGFGKKLLTHKRSGTTSPCWTGYIQKGTKIKGGKVVPNCVKINEECAIEETAPKEIDKDHETAKKLGLSHRKGNVVHAGLAVKGGAGYRGVVTKIDDDYTWINIGKNKFGDRIVKAPHRLVTKEEKEINKDETLERQHQKNEKLKKIIDEKNVKGF